MYRDSAPGLWPRGRVGALKPMRREITSAGTVSGRAALTYGGGALSSPIHDGRRYTTFSQSGKEIWLRDHPLFRSGLTSLTGGFRDEREWRSVASDAEVVTAEKDLQATVFGPGWTLWTQPERAGFPAAILLRRFVSSWLSAIEGQMLQLLPAVGRGDLIGWSLVEVQRNARHMFEDRPYDCPYGFREHFTENFAIGLDGSLVFQDTEGDQIFPAPDGERFICLVCGPASPYGSEPVAGQLWFTWQLKRTHEQQQARGVRQAITGTPLFDAAELTEPGATEGEMVIAEDRLRLNLERIAELAEEFGILVAIGGLQYKEVVTAGKASDWADLLDRINSMIRRIRIGETLTAQSEDAGGNRAASDSAQVSRMARARMYGAQVQAVINQQLIRHCVQMNFPSADPEDIPRLRLRALSPVSIEYVQALQGWEGAELDADVLYDAWGLSAPHAGTQRILKAGGRAPVAAADPLATSPDPRQLPGTGTAEGPQMSRLPARATALRARVAQMLQEDAEAIEAGAVAIEEAGSPSLEAVLSIRMRELRAAVRETADPETGIPKA